MGIDDVNTNPEDVLIATEQAQAPKVDPYSKVILLLFCLCELAVTFQYKTCTPIGVPLSLSYGTDALIIGSITTMQMFLYPILTVPSTMVMNRYGLAIAIKLGSAIVLTGSLLRCITILTDEFFWVIIGSFLIGVGRPFIINMQGSLTSLWFLPESRTNALSLFNFLMTVSFTGGTVLSSLMFYGYDKKASDAKEDGRRRFNLLLMIEFGISLLAYVPTLLFFRKKFDESPPVPKKFIVQAKLLFSNVKYILIFVSSSLCFGNFKAFGVVLPFMINYYGFKVSDNAILGKLFTINLALAPILGGLVSSILVSKAYRKVGRFKPLVIGIQVFTAGLVILIFPTLESGNLWIVSILKLVILLHHNKLFGFFITPSVPLLIEWGCKVAYPVSDVFAIGILQSGATLGGALLGEVQIYLVKGDKADRNSILITIIFMASLYALAMVLTAFNRETLEPKVKALEQTDDPTEDRIHFKRAYTCSDSVDVANVIHIERNEHKATFYDFEKESSEDTTQEALIRGD